MPIKLSPNFNLIELTKSSTAMRMGIDNTPSDLTHLVNQFSLLRNKYLGIMKGLDTKQWQIGHITRLRTAGMEDIVID